MTIYRYLLSQYLKVLLFCVASFIGVLLTTRLEEIAHFAASGARTASVLWYGLYQIPYILPIVIPVSCLISAILLVQRLSASQELTALRASGLSLRHIFTPILLTSAFVALVNFYVVSELATESHLAARSLENEFRSINPLQLLQNQHLSRLKDVYVHAMKGMSAGDTAKDFVLAAWDKKNKRINIFNAKLLGADGTTLYGEDVSIIGNTEGPFDDDFDNVFIENIAYLESSFQDFTSLLKKSVWHRKHNDYLKMSLLLHHLRYEYQKLLTAKTNFLGPEEIRKIKESIGSIFSEISRRLSLSLAVFTFTLMGLAFSINIGRTSSRKGVFAAMFLAVLFLLCFFTAKGMEKYFAVSSSLYLTPHFLIVVSSIRAIKHVSEGIE